MSNLDKRDQVVLGIDFNKSYTAIVKYKIDENEDIEFVTHNDKPFSPKITINKESGEVQVGVVDNYDDKLLEFSSIYEFIDLKGALDIAKTKWNKEDLVAAPDFRTYETNKKNTYP